MCSNTYKLYSIIKVVYRGSQKSVANYVIGNEIPRVLYRNPTEIPQESHRYYTGIPLKSHRNPTDIIQQYFAIQKKFIQQTTGGGTEGGATRGVFICDYIGFIPGASLRP